MSTYLNNRQTGSTDIQPQKPRTYAQQRQLKMAQLRSAEKRKAIPNKQDKIVEKAEKGVETGLNVGFGGWALAEGMKAFTGAAPRVAAMGLSRFGKGKLRVGAAIAKYGGAALNTALGAGMLGEGISSLVRKKKPEHVTPNKFDRIK